MIKLFTLENLSAFSSDAIYKICLSLDRYGLADSNVFSFANYDMLLDEAETALAAGDYVIIAAENSDYSNVKHIVASRFMLGEVSAPVIAETISMKRNSIREAFDMEEQCTVPSGSKVHLSEDGLYSAVSLELSNGLCSLVPLDFDRLDSVLEGYVSSVLNRAEKAAKTTAAPVDVTIEPVSQMVEALERTQRNIGIATGEATMKIYNLYSKIDALSSVVNFVDVIDETAKAKSSESENENSVEMFLEDLDSEEAQNDSEASEENEPENQAKEETPSAKTGRIAREAMRATSSRFGAAISELYEEEKEDGTVKYFVYVAVANGDSCKTKVIATVNKDEIPQLFEHSVVVLSQTVCQIIEGLEVKPEEKKPETFVQLLIKNRIAIFAAAVLAVAIIVPLLIVHMVYGGGAQPETTLPDIITGANQVDLPVSQLTPTASTAPAPSTTNPFGLPGEYTTVPDSGFAPAEPPATEVSVQPTTQLVASTSGTFTFYVFGYGHGAGMSQTGANYLASQGWNYAQILANYYYGTTLVSGETYPETIKYNAQEYKTRDFLAGVLEAEMGSSFLPEALKAQAVAAYTFAKYYAYNLDRDKMAYEPTTSQVCYDAVDAIMKSGVYISYGGSTALTPFFATSAGKTTSYYNVWGQYDLPYLQGGRPSFGDYSAPNFKQVKTYSSADLKSIIQSKDSSITLSGDPSTWISVISHDGALNSSIGYVSSINVGGKIMSGNDFRTKIMGGDLNSHCFMIEYKPD